jgi:hypothetical protein
VREQGKKTMEAVEGKNKVEAVQTIGIVTQVSYFECKKKRKEKWSRKRKRQRRKNGDEKGAEQEQQQEIGEEKEIA